MLYNCIILIKNCVVSDTVNKTNEILLKQEHGIFVSLTMLLKQ